MQIPVSKFTDNIFEWQLWSFAAFDEGTARFLMLECHRRARKTAFILNLLIREAIRNPNSVYPYVGPTYRQAKSIIWRDPNMLFTFLPDKREIPWVANESELYIRFPNGSILPIKGADDPDSLRGLDARGVGFDEWALQKENVWTEIFRPIIAQSSERWAAFGYTPKGDNHATRMFDYAACIDSGGTRPDYGVAPKLQEEWFAVRVLASKSGIISPSELKKARKEMPPALYEQEFECARIIEEERTLITSVMLDSLRNKDWDYTAVPRIKRIIACDPAFGGDECVAYVIENTKIVDDKFMHYRDTGKVVGELLNLSYKHDIRNFIVDCIGNGKGVADGLAEKSDKRRPLDVIYFDSGEKSTEERLANKRAEAWWYVMQQVFDMEVQYPIDAELRRQIPYGSRYNTDRPSGKLIMQPKKMVRKQLGRSPDRADAWMMGIYGLSLIEPESEKPDRYREKRSDVPSAMCM